MKLEKIKVGHCYWLSKRTTSFPPQYVKTMASWTSIYSNNNQETEVITIVTKSPSLKSNWPQKFLTLRWLNSNRGAEGKDEGKEKTGNYTQHVNAWFSVTLMGSTVSYITREPIPTPLHEAQWWAHTFMDVSRMEREGEGRGGRKVNVVYTKRNGRDHPPLALRAFFLFVLHVFWICVPCQSLFIERYHNLRALHISFLCENQVSFICVFPFH